MFLLLLGLELASRPFFCAADVWPSARSTHNMHKMPVPLVLIEDIADHAVTAPAHDVVILPALVQVHLGAEILALFALFIIADDKAGLHQRTWAYAVAEIRFVGMAHNQPYRFGSRAVQLHIETLLAQLLGHRLAGRPHHFFDKAHHMAAPRHHDHAA